MTYPYIIKIHCLDEEVPYTLKCRNKDEIIKSLKEWAESGGYWGMSIEHIDIQRRA